MSKENQNDRIVNFLKEKQFHQKKVISQVGFDFSSM